MLMFVWYSELPLHLKWKIVLSDSATSAKRTEVHWWSKPDNIWKLEMETTIQNNAYFATNELLKEFLETVVL